MEPAGLSRRDLLRTAGIGAIGLAGGRLRRSASAGQPGREKRGAEVMPRALTTLSDHLAVHRGAIHVGIVRNGRKALLIDCGDGAAAGTLGKLGLTSVGQVVFTHHHRDQAFGAPLLAAGGARICVPASERAHFDNVEAYWNGAASRWHLYNLHPHHLMLAESVRVDATLDPGDTLAWGPAKITVLPTPGHTDGSVSYLVEVDGRRVVFCGDALYDVGQVWDIHSLQKGTQTTDYHGFLGARAQLAKSLAAVKATKCDCLVPSHGRVMTNPAKAIDTLLERLEVCYDRYVAISALRHYFPKLFAEYAGRAGHMPIRKGKAPPACLRHFGTTWMLVSKDKSAFVMDCGGPQVVAELKRRLRSGRIRAVEGLWITHYHDDHVNAVPAFQKTFDCPLITDRSVADIISDPLAWRLPCISPSKARVDRATKDGESWKWHEFKMTAYRFPGQTLYHGGLLVEHKGLRMFFSGDSFTMAGIDDYCTSNRNWLGRGVGFDRCVALMAKLKPTHIFNCHVDVAFTFTPDECRLMRANLAEREKLYGQIVPWDHANYGMDEPWVRCHPYEQRCRVGARAAFDVVVTNHSSQAHPAACRAVLPRAWGAAQKPTRRTRAQVAAKTEGRLRLSFPVPRDVKPGRYVIPIDLRYADWDLPQFTEAIVVV
jgi:glyoxylase-like metal-dependent hydrolase (beta-lactamase superfamily II)